MVTVLLVVVIFLAFGEDVYTSGDSFSAVVVLFVLHGYHFMYQGYTCHFLYSMCMRIWTHANWWWDSIVVHDRRLFKCVCA